MDIGKFNSYEVENLGIVAAASCGTQIFVTLFCYMVSIGMAATSLTLIIPSIWCIGAVVVTVMAAYYLSRTLPWFPPSWLFVPLFSSFLYIFSFGFYVYWVSISNYSPNNPFQSKPPSSDYVVFYSLFFSLILSLISIGVTLTSHASWVCREKPDKRFLP